VAGLIRRSLRGGPSPPLAPARRFGVALAAIVALGVGLRALQTLLVAPWPPGIFNDEAYYSTLAHLVASGHGFVRPAEYFGDHISIPTAERAPLFTTFVAALYKLGFHTPEGRLVGLFTGGGTIAALGLLGRRLAGERAGLIAAGIAALYPILIAADGAMMTESTYGVFAAFSLVVAYRLLDRPPSAKQPAQPAAHAPPIAYGVLLGVLLGLAALARGEALLLAPLLLIAIVRRRGGWRPGAWKVAGVVVVAFALVLTPWTIRNWSAFDRPVLVATEGGETLAGANCDVTYYGRRIGTWQYSCARFDGHGNEAKELNEAGHRGVRYARHHAGRVPLVLAARLARTWGAWEPFAVPEGRRKWVQQLGTVVYFALIPFAVWGIVLLRRRRVPLLIVLAPFVTVTLTTLLAYGQIRFRHSAELSLVVLAAVAVDGLLHQRTRRNLAA
jgi:4-amino-4-deoxy-L-arabinose transferase-like glycosyltransferase